MSDRCVLAPRLNLNFVTWDTFLTPANEVWGKVMFLHLSVTGADTPWADLLGRRPLGRHPPWEGTPRQTPLGRHPGQTAPCLFGYYRIWSTSGRYTSYYNANLLSFAMCSNTLQSPRNYVQCQCRFIFLNTARSTTAFIKYIFIGLKMFLHHTIEPPF